LRVQMSKGFADVRFEMMRDQASCCMIPLPHTRTPERSLCLHKCTCVCSHVQGGRGFRRDMAVGTEKM
jgi:hypothetical protein